MRRVFRHHRRPGVRLRRCRRQLGPRGRRSSSGAFCRRTDAGMNGITKAGDLKSVEESAMPLVPENRLKGHYGTALVMSRLSSECLVRPVAADTDVGVDLYCETVAENRPFLHFWLQVKAGDQCRLDAGAERASCSFEIEHLNYWARQPVPVFAALVPAEWPVPREPDIYIVDITTQSVLNSFPSTPNTVTLW